MLSAGRTSKPSTLPGMPEIFQVLTTAFLLVSTIETVLSPESAATSAACAAVAPISRAAEAARMVRIAVELFMALSLGIAVADCDHLEYGRGRETDAWACVKEN